MVLTSRHDQLINQTGISLNMDNFKNSEMRDFIHPELSLLNISNISDF
jgi:hypothetical protein